MQGKRWGSVLALSAKAGDIVLSRAGAQALAFASVPAAEAEGWRTASLGVDGSCGLSYFGNVIVLVFNQRDTRELNSYIILNLLYSNKFRPTSLVEA